MKHSLKFLAVITVALFFSACTALNADVGKEPVNLIQRTLQSQAVFSPWGSKSYGEKTPYDTITVLTSRNLEGDIVILRWNDAGTDFTTELYRQSSTQGIFKSWEYQNGSVSKSIDQQPSGSFFVSELIEGEDGGSRKEIFTLEQ